MRHSSLSTHHAERIELQGRYGAIAALRAKADTETPEAAPITLLLPGYTGSKEDFAPLLDPIAAAGFEAVAVDLPGQYESAGPEVENEYLPSMLGAVIVELTEKFVADGRTLLLLGHSFGGLLARGAVLGGAPVSGLTLLDSGPGELPDGDRRRALVEAAPVLREDGIEAAWRARRELNERSDRWASTPEELKRFEHDVFVGTAPSSLLGMGQALLDEPDLTDALAAALRAAGVPCAVVYGEHDDAWSPETQREMAHRLGASSHVVTGARHSPNVENPSDLLDVLLPLWSEWTGRTAPSPPPEEPQQ